MIINSLLVGIGGFFGAMARFGLSKHFNRPQNVPLPVGTLIVNLLGSFLLGVIIVSQLDRYWTLCLGTGFMGAFTTFSTFKMENIQMLLEKKWRGMLVYLAVSYIGGIMLAFLGMVLVS